MLEIFELKQGTLGKVVAFALIFATYFFSFATKNSENNEFLFFVGVKSLLVCWLFIIVAMIIITTNVIVTFDH